MPVDGGDYCDSFFDCEAFSHLFFCQLVENWVWLASVGRCSERDDPCVIADMRGCFVENSGGFYERAEPV